MWLWDLLFPSVKASGSGIPADHKGSHDTRDDETVDGATGIAKEDGQIVTNTSIDVREQEKIKGFDVKDPENPEKSKKLR
jgi:hypothetical protein